MPGGGQWYDLNWAEWAGLLGLQLTIVGLYVTWDQARRARSAVKAAVEAVATTEAEKKVLKLIHDGVGQAATTGGSALDIGRAQGDACLPASVAMAKACDALNNSLVMNTSTVAKRGVES